MSDLNRSRFSLVTGVILANASLDVALHDTYTFIIPNNNIDEITHLAFNNQLLTSNKEWNLVNNNISNGLIMVPMIKDEKLAAFVVGLIDGEGSLEVNHRKKKYLQYRLVVKLKNNGLNLRMLKHIASIYGGQVNITPKHKVLTSVNLCFGVISVLKTASQYVQWTINDKEIIEKTILPLFATNPPLTTRITLQLAFVIKALDGMTIKEYLELRKLKYITRPSLIPLFDTLPTYFSSWLSGFIEVKGSFAIRSGPIGFSLTMSQLNDDYLMFAILKYFNLQHMTIQLKNHIYSIEIANKKGVETVVKHIVDYPLQGYKYYQLAKVMKDSKSLSHLRGVFWK